MTALTMENTASAVSERVAGLKARISNSRANFESSFATARTNMEHTFDASPDAGVIRMSVIKGDDRLNGLLEKLGLRQQGEKSEGMRFEMANASLNSIDVPTSGVKPKSDVPERFNA